MQDADDDLDNDVIGQGNAYDADDGPALPKGGKGGKKHRQGHAAEKAHYAADCKGCKKTPDRKLTY